MVARASRSCTAREIGTRPPKTLGHCGNIEHTLDGSLEIVPAVRAFPAKSNSRRRRERLHRCHELRKALAVSLRWCSGFVPTGTIECDWDITWINAIRFPGYDLSSNPPTQALRIRRAHLEIGQYPAPVRCSVHGYTSRL